MNEINQMTVFENNVIGLEKNGITQINGEQMMSHLQLVDVLNDFEGKTNEVRPDKVKQSMKRLGSKGAIQVTPLGEVNHLGQKVTNYYVNERDSYIVVAQMSPVFTAHLVDFWVKHREAEQPMVQLPNFNNPVAAARAWAEELEQKQKLQIENKQQAQTLIGYKPKADFVDDVFIPSGGSISLGDFGRILFEDHGFKTGPVLIFNQLRKHGIIRKDRALPYMRYAYSGDFKVKQVLKNHRAYPTAFLTPRGQLKVHNLLKGEQ